MKTFMYLKLILMILSLSMGAGAAESLSQNLYSETTVSELGRFITLRCVRRPRAAITQIACLWPASHAKVEAYEQPNRAALPARLARIGVHISWIQDAAERLAGGQNLERSRYLAYLRELQRLALIDAYTIQVLLSDWAREQWMTSEASPRFLTGADFVRPLIDDLTTHITLDDFTKHVYTSALLRNLNNLGFAEPVSRLARVAETELERLVAATLAYDPVPASLSSGARGNAALDTPMGFTEILANLMGDAQAGYLSLSVLGDLSPNAARAPLGWGSPRTAQLWLSSLTAPVHPERALDLLARVPRQPIEREECGWLTSATGALQSEGTEMRKALAALKRQCNRQSIGTRRAQVALWSLFGLGFFAADTTLADLEDEAPETNIQPETVALLQDLYVAVAVRDLESTSVSVRGTDPERFANQIQRASLLRSLKRLNKDTRAIKPAGSPPNWIPPLFHDEQEN